MILNNRYIFICLIAILIIFPMEIMAQPPDAVAHTQIQGTQGFPLQLRLISEADALAAGHGVIKMALPGGGTACADLVDTTDINASPLRVYTDAVYSWRAYECDECIDSDDNEYSVVRIGNQCWTAENLKTKHYREGSTIPNVTSDFDWRYLTTGAYCYFDNNPANGNIFGILYNGFAVNDSRCLCPEGWHVPTDNEAKALEMYLGMTAAQADSSGRRGSNQGSQLCGNATLWADGALESDPDFGYSGFDHIPGGYRSHDSYYRYENWTGFFWTSSNASSYQNFSRITTYSRTAIERSYSDLNLGLSVRCICDMKALIHGLPATTLPEDSTFSLRAEVQGGAGPYQYDWNTDGVGDWDDFFSIGYTVATAIDTIICCIRDLDLTVACDTVVVVRE